jgi:putative phosphoesterase
LTALNDAVILTIGVISDTHGVLASPIFDIFANVDHILHAGDVQELRILDELEEIAPVNAVCGNVDFGPTQRLPEKWCGTFAGVKICMTHGHLLDPSRYNESAVKMFAGENPAIIIHGHSHKAKHETLGKTSILNPGAACRPRFRDTPSVAMIFIKPGANFHIEFREIPWPAR